jgi:hypothetical protein
LLRDPTPDATSSAQEIVIYYDILDLESRLQSHPWCGEIIKIAQYNCGLHQVTNPKTDRVMSKLAVAIPFDLQFAFSITT